MQNKIHSFSLTRGQSYYCGVCCVCCTEPWRHRARLKKKKKSCKRVLSSARHSAAVTIKWKVFFSCVMSAGDLSQNVWQANWKALPILFLIFPLAKPLVEQHEKCSFHDRSNLAIAAAGSLETIFRASSHTLQVPPRNGHLFIISPPELAPSINSAS